MTAEPAVTAISSEEAQEACRRWEEEFTRFEQIDETTFIAPGREPWPGSAGTRIGGPAMITSAMLMLSQSLGVTNLHSFKAVFFKLGDQRLPTRYQFEPLRDSRNCITRGVKVSQEGQLCATLTLSFTTLWEGLAHQFVEAPEFGNPLTNPEMWVVANMPSRPDSMVVEIRMAVTAESPRLRAYFRLLPAFSSNPVWRAAVRASMTDGPVAATPIHYHGLPHRSGVSLDHQVWFHRPLSFDGWNLFDLSSDIAVGNRMLVQGRIWDEHGVLHATVMQEVSYRPPGNVGGPVPRSSREV